MEDKTKVDSVTAGIELVAKQVTPQVEATREDATESVVYPSSELNALMEVIKEELDRVDVALSKKPSEPLTPILVDELNLDELEATAAGLGAGGGGDGSTFVRLLRIVEGVDPLSYDYTFERQDVPDVEYYGVLNVEEISQGQDSPPDVFVPEEPKDPNDEDPKDEDEEDDNPPSPDPDDEEEEEDKEEEDKEDEDDPVKDHQDNGWGNGDDDPPGNSGPNNNAENSDAENPLTKDKDNGNGAGNPSDGSSDPDNLPSTNGSNPGNDKAVGNSPWDGETGSSGKPGNGNHQDGLDTDDNQPGGKEKGQNLNIDDLLSDEQGYDRASYDHFPDVDLLFTMTKPINLE